jgi:hypothetical protein
MCHIKIVFVFFCFEKHIKVVGPSFGWPPWTNGRVDLDSCLGLNAAVRRAIISPIKPSLSLTGIHKLNFSLNKKIKKIIIKKKIIMSHNKCSHPEQRGWLIATPAIEG